MLHRPVRLDRRAVWLTPVVDGAIQKAEVHLQLVDVVRGRRIAAAASFAANTVLVANVPAVPEDGCVLDIDAGARLGLENLPALRLSSELFSQAVNASINGNKEEIDRSLPCYES